MNERKRRPSKLSDKCMTAWSVDGPGVTIDLEVRLSVRFIANTYCSRLHGAINDHDCRPVFIDLFLPECTPVT